MDATWANFKFGRASSELPNTADPENDLPHSPTTKEVRRGYFDLHVPNNGAPKIFTIAPSTHSTSSDEQDDHSHHSSNSTVEPSHVEEKDDVVRAVAFRPKLEYIGRAYSSLAPSIASKEQKSRKERLIDFLHRRFPSRIVRRVLKCTIAYFISTLFSLITPVANALGQSAFLTTAGVVFSHPGRSMGAQFDATITAALGVCCGMAFAYAGLASSVAYNVRHTDSTEVSSAINAAFLFVGIFLAQTLRQKFPAFFFFSLQAMIIMIFSFSTGPGMKQLVLPTHLPLQFGLPLLMGTAISQVVNLFIWPETAVEGLGRALQETFASSKEMLDMMSKQFFLDPGTDMLPGEKVDKTAQKMRAGITKVKTAYRESKREISRTYLNPYELGGITKSLDRLTKHLSILGGSLKTERTLFESALASLERETELQTSETPQHPTEPNDENNKRSSTLRWIDSEDEIQLRKAAMLATGEYCKTGKYTSPQNSRPNSRAGSRRNSFDEEENQKSVSSLRSFLKLSRFSGTVPKPPAKANRQIEHGDGELLITYLESLRDPLMRLSKECAAVLDCINYSIAVELDMDDENDISIRETWVAYIRHLLKLKKPAKTNAPAVINKENGRRHDPKNCDCAKVIHEAIKNFDESEHERMRTLYHLNRKKLGSETLDLGLREELFLVFFFIFSLREVANELESMAKNMDKIRSSRKGKHFYMPQLTPKWWKKWASSMNHQSVRDKGGYSLANLEMAMPKETRKTDCEDEYRLTRAETIDTTRSAGSRRRISSITSPKASSSVAESTGVSPMLTEETLGTRKRLRAAPADIEKAFTEEQQEDKAPKPPILLRLRYGLWVRLQYFKTYEFRSALKMALAVSILSLPAFISSSSAWYESVRGQWACMTVIAIMNPTSGGTWQASFWRVIGTLLGGFMGWAALEANGGSPYLLATFGVLLSIPFFYIHLASTHNKIGIVVLLTYMAVALSRYVHPPDEPIAHTVWKRTATVVVGVLVAVSLNWMIWPFVARHAVRKSIAGIIGELGDYFGYLMGTFLYHDSDAPPSEDDIKRVQKIEAKIQKTIDAAAVLLDLTDHEPRLKGPFPKAFYREMIVALRNLLDRMLSMRTALSVMPAPVKKNITLPEYNQLRRDMTAAVILNFYTLQSSLQAKIPFPAYIPSARAARLRLIRYRRKRVPNPDKWVQYKNICWFAMASCTEEIIEELEHLNDLVKYIVGESKFADRTRRIDSRI